MQFSRVISRTSRILLISLWCIYVVGLNPNCHFLSWACPQSLFTVLAKQRQTNRVHSLPNQHQPTCLDLFGCFKPPSFDSKNSTGHWPSTKTLVQKNDPGTWRQAACRGPDSLRSLILDAPPNVPPATTARTALTLKRLGMAWDGWKFDEFSWFQFQKCAVEVNLEIDAWVVVVVAFLVCLE